MNRKKHISFIKKIIIFLVLPVASIYLIETYRILPIAPQYTTSVELTNYNEFIVKFPAKALSTQLFIKGCKLHLVKSLKFKIESNTGDLILSSSAFEHKEDKIYLYPQIIDSYHTFPASLFANNEEYKMTLELSFTRPLAVPINASLHMHVFIQTQHYNRSFHPFNKQYIKSTS